MASPEYLLQVASVEHINSAFIGAQNPNLKFWHVPNQVKDAKEAFFKKKMGVLAGVLDLMFGWPVSHAGVLELKVDSNLSSSQNKFISWAHEIGWHTGSARSVCEVHNILLGWGLKAAHHSIVEPDYATKEEKFQRANDFFYEKIEVSRPLEAPQKPLSPYKGGMNF